MLCYDQLNLGALASAEALNRRRSLIEAGQGRPEAPSYEGAEEFLGIREAMEGSVIDQHAAKRQAAKAEVLKQNRLAAEEKPHLRPGPPDKPKRAKGGGKANEKSSGSTPHKDHGLGMEGAYARPALILSTNNFSRVPHHRFGDFFHYPNA